jgi:uncharacterized RDD family membrane protein YckC
MVINLIVAALALVVIAFSIAFGYLIVTAFPLVSTSIGLNMSFSGYEYISILVTFFSLMLYGGYYVFSSATRRPTIEVDVLE